MTGKSHDIEPEADSLNYIDFEWEAAQPTVQVGWTLQQMCTIIADHPALAQEVVDNRHWDEAVMPALRAGHMDTAWLAFEGLCNEAGFDTYNSDTRFEVFPGGTQEVEA